MFYHFVFTEKSDFKSEEVLLNGSTQLFFACSTRRRLYHHIQRGPHPGGNGAGHWAVVHVLALKRAQGAILFCVVFRRTSDLATGPTQIIEGRSYETLRPASMDRWMRVMFLCPH